MPKCQQHIELEYFLFFFCFCSVVQIIQCKILMPINNERKCDCMFVALVPWVNQMSWLMRVEVMHQYTQNMNIHQIIFKIRVKQCGRQTAVANAKCQCAFYHLADLATIHTLQQMKANPCRQIIMIARTQVGKGEWDMLGTERVGLSWMLEVRWRGG